VKQKKNGSFKCPDEISARNLNSSYHVIYLTMEQKSTRDVVISYLQTLPDDVSMEDIMYHLYVQEKIWNGLKDVEEGKIVSNEKAKEIMDSWLK
jgi:predicted transcriptional regulator